MLVLYPNVCTVYHVCATHHMDEDMDKEVGMEVNEEVDEEWPVTIFSQNVPTASCVCYPPVLAAVTHPASTHYRQR